MPRSRLPASDRRSLIVAAAAPLFARSGFAGTTTKELAQAAGVSEALLYKYFPSKEALYEEILNLEPVRADYGFQKLRAMKPSTETLIYFTHFLLRRFYVGYAGESFQRLQNMHRLAIRSLTEDGEFARELFATSTARALPQFSASFAAAKASGELAPGILGAKNAFWLVHHVAVMFGFTRLPKQAMITWTGADEEVVRQAVVFVLRGFGMSEAVLSKRYVPGRISRAMDADEAGLLSATEAQ